MWDGETGDGTGAGPAPRKVDAAEVLDLLTCDVWSCVGVYQKALKKIDVSTLLSERTPMCLKRLYSIPVDPLGLV